jgi:tetratricopeptide (TPR) repeat protein
VIVRVVRLLDQMLDQNPQDRQVWLRLGEALAIGNANSSHAQSASAAWRQAYQLDKSDCHVGALATPWSEQREKEQWIRQLAQDHPQCPEVFYLRALISQAGSTERTTFLRNSLALRSSSDAQIELAQDLIQTLDWKKAIESYSSALSAAPLFPEDWRPDGRTAVHTHLGLAWAHYSRGRMREARREYKLFLKWFTEPGPWHDLSATEKQWYEKLEARFQ